jgi:hypothetical protein
MERLDMGTLKRTSAVSLTEKGRTNALTLSKYDEQALQAVKRALQANVLRTEKKEFQEIGTIIGVSATRARQLAKKGARYARVNAWWGDDLPWRYGWLLNEAGCTSKDGVKAAIISGKIGFEPNSKQQANIGGLGKKGLAIICEWVGIDMPVPILHKTPTAFVNAIRAGISYEEALILHVGGSATTRAACLTTLQAIEGLTLTEIALLCSWATKQESIRSTKRYDLDLTCSNYNPNKLGTHDRDEFPYRYSEDRKSICLEKARKAGWHIGKDGYSLCPKCMREAEAGITERKAK